MAGRITAAELSALAGQVAAGEPWQGTARVAGADRPVLAVLSDATPKGAFLVLVRTPDAASAAADAVAAIQALWDLLTSHFDRFVAEAVPGALAQSRAAAGERARVMAELGEAHTAALTGILSVVRSHVLDDATARGQAADLAVTALAELRATTALDREVGEEPAGEAFDRLADTLRPLFRHTDVHLELGPPEASRISLASDVAHVARAVVRGVVLAVLEQEPVHRVHVGWQLPESGEELRVTVRDDGPGDLTRDVLAGRRVGARLDVLGGRLDVDAVPGWGTTVTATVPLTAPRAAAAHPLADLGPRELEVLSHLARGHRNRVIAQDLHISESTVKFHVANILSKLEVGSRGEAAAMFHAAA
ncbi:LuxR C-terminal-related transcriptional regulator [Streptomyces sp. NPDC056656]|uniref:helix-turn-helix transcriptional regulator n=1 Tax=Streptomyces sp. NPDC056656 TaxID=3345895 RepID=UPI0036D13BBC